MFAAHQLRQVSVTLCIRAIQTDLVYAQVGMCAVGESDRAGRARDLFHGNRVCKIAETGAAPALRHRHAQQSLFTEGRPEVARKLVAPVDLRRPGCNAFRREATYLGADLLDALIQSEIAIYGSHVLAFPFCTIV